MRVARRARGARRGAPAEPEVSGALFMKSHGFVVTADLSGALASGRSNMVRGCGCRCAPSG